MLLKRQVSFAKDKLLKDIIWVVPIKRGRFAVDYKEIVSSTSLAALNPNALDALK